MRESRREKWQERSKVLEPDERVVAATRGLEAPTWLIFLLGDLYLAFFGRLRAWIVTDRNVYICKASWWRQFTATSVIEKHRLGEAEVAYHQSRLRPRLTLNGQHGTFIEIGAGSRAGAREIAAAVGAAEA
jgi:hypothetical protein